MLTRCRYISVVLIVSTFVIGCETVKLPTYESSVDAGRFKTMRLEGVEVRVEPFVETERNLKYFGFDTLKKGLLPIYVVVTNVNSKDPFLLMPETFKIESSGLSMTGGLANKITNKPAGASTMGFVGAALLPASGVLSFLVLAKGSQMVGNANEIEMNFLRQELANQSLSSGQSVQGFLYFSNTNRNFFDPPLLLSVSVKNLNTGRTLSFDFK